MDERVRIDKLYSEINTLESALEYMRHFTMEHIYKTQVLRRRLNIATGQLVEFEMLKGAEKNNDTAKHSERMFDLQRDILCRAENGQAAAGEPDGADLSEMPGRETAEGAAELPPRFAPEQEQVSRLLRIELSREDANDLLTLVDITYNQVLDAKNCSDSDACLELAADFRRLYDNLQAAIENASESRLLEVRADGQNI